MVILSVERPFFVSSHRVHLLLQCDEKDGFAFLSLGKVFSMSMVIRSKRPHHDGTMQERRMCT